MTLSLMGLAALAYVERLGWSVFPLAPRTKEPLGRLVRHGHKDATRNPEQIVRWWSAAPDAGVALSCITSGIVVLDADLYKDTCEFHVLERQLGPLPETPRQLTPQGGVHYLFRDGGGRYANPCSGAESKHDGYIVLAPSVHPNGGIYRWDLGAHPLETPVATLPDAWVAHLTIKAKTVLPSTGLDSACGWLGYAFAAMGWLGGPTANGGRMVRCPWLHEHTDGRGDGRDSSTILFPRAAGHTLGGFYCSHAHCANRRWRDVRDVLPVAVKKAADRAIEKERNRVTFARIVFGRSL